MMAPAKWCTLYGDAQKPTWEQISSHVNSDLWEQLNLYLQRAYDVEPELAYSICAGQPGWNIKYKKSSKALCTLYPEDGFFIALVVVGRREAMAVDALLPSLSDYIHGLYASSRDMAMGRWLMINVTDEQILDDVKTLIGIRVKPKAS